MHLFALDPLWSDFFTVGGFAVAVFGFAYTIRQVWKVQVAADAAKAAAQETLDESRASFERFIGTHASRLVTELDDAVNTKNWPIAKIRAHDLAELFATLRDPDNTTNLIVEDLRNFGQVFAENCLKTRASYDREKFRAVINQVRQRLDRLREPFPEERRGHGESNRPAGDAQKHSTGPTVED